jgi:hypothetical protein
VALDTVNGDEDGGAEVEVRTVEGQVVATEDVTVSWFDPLYH